MIEMPDNKRTDQRSTTFVYDPITKIFNEKSCMVSEIDIPVITRNVCIPVFVTKEKSVQNYRVPERKEIVNFKVKFVPLNNADGKKLLIQAKNIVDEVLTDKFKPQVAVINMLRNDKIESTVTINDAITQKCSIELDKSDYLHIVFELQGVLSENY